MVFIKSSKNKVWTLPPDIRDLIPSDHICYLVECFVDEMDFSEFEIKYEGSGHPAYHPRIMFKILIQSMLDRVRSSRAIAATFEKILFTCIWLKNYNLIFERSVISETKMKI